MKTILEKLKEILHEYREFDNVKIPLCAAETYVSEFVLQALSTCLEGKYIMGNIDREPNEDFIGSDKLYPIYKLIREECRTLFGATYADARPLTGMNTVMLLIAGIVKGSRKVLLTTPEQGGHSSVPLLLDLYGVNYESVPYDYDNFQINYLRTNYLLSQGEYDHIIFCQSDLIAPPDFNELKIPPEVGLLYDGTQTLGLMIGKQVQNPLEFYHKSILFGGTHKTLPGPTCGLVMTNDKSLAVKSDSLINPDYLRNIQINNVTGLLLALIEQEAYAETYQKSIVDTANMLGAMLENRGFGVARLSDGRYSRTHQIFILTDRETSERIYLNAVRFNVTLNKKHKALFRNDGIRLGVQEIARYGWGESELELLSEVLYKLAYRYDDDDMACKIRELSSKKTPRYILNDIFMN